MRIPTALHNLEGDAVYSNGFLRIIAPDFIISIELDGIPDHKPCVFDAKLLTRTATELRVMDDRFEIVRKDGSILKGDRVNPDWNMVDRAMRLLDSAPSPRSWVTVNAKQLAIMADAMSRSKTKTVTFGMAEPASDGQSRMVAMLGEGEQDFALLSAILRTNIEASTEWKGRTSGEEG